MRAYATDRGRVARLDGPTGLLALYDYNDDGWLTRVDFPDGSGFRYSYDDLGQLLQVTDAGGNVVETHTYSADYRGLTSSRGGGQERLTLSYGPNSAQVTDSGGGTTSFSWTDVRGMRAITVRDGACEDCGGGGAQREAWTYTPEGRVESHERGGLVTNFTYNGQGDIETVAEPEQRLTSFGYVYNPEGQILSATRTAPGGGRKTWNLSGPLLSSIVEQTGSEEYRTTSFGYHHTGRLASMTDPGGKLWRFDYDQLGDMIGTTDPKGSRTSYTYDAQGRLASVTDPLGKTTFYERDAVGRVKTVTLADGNKLAFTYDGAGRLSSTEDPLKRKTQRGYDGQGRLQSVLDAAHGTTTFGYSSRSRMTRLTDAEGRATRFEYYPSGELQRVVYPDQASESYEYESHGWLKKRTDPRGVVTEFSYDDLGRLEGKTYSDGTPAVSYTYNTAGLLESAANGTDTLTWTYDLAGRLLSEQSALSGSNVSYTYGPRGERLDLRLNSELVATYRYDDALQLEQLLTSLGTFSFGHDAAGRRRTMAYPNGAETTYDYNDLSRLTSLVATRNGPIASFGYALDAVGNRTEKATAAWTESYRYDALDRLKAAERSGQPARWHFGYDRVGNRVQEQAADGARRSTFNSRNQLTAVVGGGTQVFRGTLDEPGSVSVAGQPARMLPGNVFEAEVATTAGPNVVPVVATDAGNNVSAETYAVEVGSASTSMHYDAAGNLVDKTDAGSTWTYTWNAENQLTRVTKDTVEVARFRYDPLGRRVEKVAAGIVYSYLHDGMDILRETRSDGTAYTYLHGPGIDEPLARIDQAGQAAYYHADGLGSIVKMTDSTGNVIQTRQYDAWGNLEVGADQPGYAFTGREWDPETGLYYYRARYYDPKIGRFISEDPIGLAGGINSYAYARNSPHNLTDPSGLITFVPADRRPGEVPASDADIKWAYDEMARLRATLTEDVAQYFWQAYSTDLDALLRSGGDLTVKLVRGNWRNAGETPDPVPVNWMLDTSPVLNLDKVCVGTDRDRFSAYLLHELAHYFHFRGGWRPGLVNKAEALDAANRASAQATAIYPNFIHGPEAFLAEIYQFGRWITYGGGR